MFIIIIIIIIIIIRQNGCMDKSESIISSVISNNVWLIGWYGFVCLPVCSLGWFNNRTGKSVDDGKARRKDCAQLPMLNLPLYHWSSQLFDLCVPSTDVWVLLLNQPIISYCKSVFYNFSKQTLVWALKLKVCLSFDDVVITCVSSCWWAVCDIHRSI